MVGHHRAHHRSDPSVDYSKKGGMEQKFLFFLRICITQRIDCDSLKVGTGSEQTICNFIED